MRLHRRDLILGLGGTLLPLAAFAQQGNTFLEHGFAPVLDELTVDNLPVRGEVPREIAGTYLRNGPNPAYSPLSYTYPFDGDGMIHGVTFEGGKVSYRNRFVLTDGLREERRADRALYGGLMGPGQSKNVANTNVVRHAGRILALYEGGLPYELSPALETKGRYDFAGKTHSAVTAHPRIDPQTGEMVIFRYSIRHPYLVVSVVDAAGNLVRETPVDTPTAYMVHDFVVTASHIVFFLCPSVFDLETARAGQFLRWEPGRGTRIAILRRDGTGGVRWVQDEPYFIFHFLNGYDASGGRIVADFVQHGAFMAPGAPPMLWRAEIDPAAGTIKRTQLDQRIGEFPRVDPARSGLVHRYGWLPVKREGDAIGAFGAIARYDLESNDVALHDFGQGREVDEPLFVPRAGARGESEGWIMIYVYDRATDGSVLAILDALDIARPPVAEVTMPRRVPHGLHGNWLPRS